LEDRVLYLEGLSPEYFSVARKPPAASQRDECDAGRRQESDEEAMASLTKINKKIEALRSSLAQRPEVAGIKVELPD
jgi:hypothetical protein